MAESIRTRLERLYHSFRPIPSRRMFDYHRRLLVNPYLAEQESGSHDLRSAVARSGHSLGYPAWNLLYYMLLCSLPPSDRWSLRPAPTRASPPSSWRRRRWTAGPAAWCVWSTSTPDVDELAKRHAERGGVASRIRFHVGDSREFLVQLRDEVDHEVDHVDFAFLHGDHRAEAVVAEFERLYPLVVACGGRSTSTTPAEEGWRRRCATSRQPTAAT